MGIYRYILIGLSITGLWTKLIWFLRARDRGRARARPFPTGKGIDLTIN